jgi:hypothetical protein
MRFHGNSPKNGARIGFGSFCRRWGKKGKGGPTFDGEKRHMAYLRHGCAQFWLAVTLFLPRILPLVQPEWRGG